MVATQTSEFQSKFLAAMTFSDDRTLVSELQPQTYRELEDFFTSRQLPIAQFARLQPWGVSLLIAMMEYQRLGMMPGYGVDAHYNDLALAEGKKVMSLETPDEQLNFLRSMETMDPDEGIEYTLRDLERAKHLPIHAVL